MDILEINYLDVEENEEDEKIIKKVLNKCMKREN